MDESPLSLVSYLTLRLSFKRYRWIFPYCLAWENRRHFSTGHQRFPREMSSKRRAQKFHTDDASLPRSGYCFGLVGPCGKFASTNQKHYPDLGKDASSVWNFCTRFSDVISRGNRLWRLDVSSVFSGYLLLFINIKTIIKKRDVSVSIVSARWMLSYVARMTLV